MVKHAAKGLEKQDTTIERQKFTHSPAIDVK